MAAPRAPGSTFRRHADELDMSQHMHAMSVGRVARLLLAGTVVAAAFGSDAFYSWAFNLPLWMEPVRDAMLAVVRPWHEGMQELGLTDLHEALREAFREFQYL